jgi:hypothetical protein
MLDALMCVWQGVHYGVFPGLQLKGALKTVWFVHRPHNWHPIDTEEALVEVDLETGNWAVLQEYMRMLAK